MPTARTFSAAGGGEGELDGDDISGNHSLQGRQRYFCDQGRICPDPRAARLNNYKGRLIVR